MNYRLNPTSKITKGFSRSIIIDLEKELFYLIPNAMADIFTQYPFGDQIDMLSKFKEIKVKNIVKEYFDFLIERDLIFFTNHPDNYVDLKLVWEYPGLISNAIIDYNSDFLFYYNTFLQFIDDSGCKSIQIRIFKKVDFKSFLNIFVWFEDSGIENVEIICHYNEEFEDEIIIANFEKFQRIKLITYFNFPSNKILYEKQLKTGKIVGIKQNLSNSSCCGNINSSYFQPTISFVSESIKHNTCLNRKISIDFEGNIKTCPSVKEVIGHITTINFNEGLINSKLKKYWDINKDEINTCKDCEFRYICSDCRAYLEQPNDIYSKPIKCGYNPYTCEWEEWNTSREKLNIFSKNYLK